MLRYRLLIIAIAFFIGSKASAQELFVYNEPASNMPAKSVGIRLNNWLMNDEQTNHTDYHLIPEIMWGASKHLMIHIDAYFSNTGNTFSAEGAGLYAKYRFYSHDKLYRHFRMAAFGRIASNNSAIHQEEIETNGYNSGYQAGLIGTQLLHKTALSVTAYYEHATNNQNGNEIPQAYSQQAFNYHFSAGRLIFPKTYTGYGQTNLNLMVELLGQSLLDNGKHYIDIAPSVQLIFNSQTRVDIGYKHQLYSDMLRSSPNSFLIRVEHLLYNVT